MRTFRRYFRPHRTSSSSHEQRATNSLNRMAHDAAGTAAAQKLLHTLSTEADGELARRLSELQTTVDRILSDDFEIDAFLKTAVSGEDRASAD